MWEEIVIPSDPRARSVIESRILQSLEEKKFAQKIIFSIRLALEEAVVNAMTHGNKLDKKKKVKVRFNVDDSRIVIEVIDEGTGFDPTTVPDPTSEENLERPSGRGLMLMQAYMDEVSFNRRGNKATMIKYKEKVPEAER